MSVITSLARKSTSGHQQEADEAGDRVVERVNEDEQEQHAGHGEDQPLQSRRNAGQAFGDALVAVLAGFADDVDETLVDVVLRRVGGGGPQHDIHQLGKRLVGLMVAAALRERMPLVFEDALGVIGDCAVDGACGVGVELDR